MITRRQFLATIGYTTLAGFASATYAAVIEPGFRLNTVTYKFTPPRWTPGLKLRAVLLADPHLVEPHMPVRRWQRIIETANALQPDMHLLLGDYVTAHPFRTAKVPVAQAANAAKALTSPLGTFAICGNHDWWDDLTAQKRGYGPTVAQKAFEDAGIPVMENRAIQLKKDGMPFWLSGTGSMIAIHNHHWTSFESRADIQSTMAMINDDAPIIHMAHEPDLFPEIPDRVSLTLSGHTHGGQVRLFGYSFITPSSYGNRFAYGHVVENGKHLIVSGGLGCSIIPIRFGMPPEIVVLELG
ncbi:MAG: metallophosphoesterase [Alphaproteobacteria bacterium]|nr:metallophosphoesterase [Alphaproteobacteria bacterium]